MSRTLETVVDFRSDTVTQPCDDMRRAMAAAPVGDDVYGEDPTVARLECEVAEMLGKDAALFVPSGTMANLIAGICHGTARTAFPEIVMGNASHTFHDEVGNLAAVARVHSRQLSNAADGTIPLGELRRALGEGEDIHYSDVCAVFLENTHSSCGGIPLQLEYVRDVAALCAAARPAERRVALHCDGARLWNAATALRVPIAELARPFDSLAVCMSKGLGAPMGSLLVGEKTFIHTAKRARKMLGGGMRQIGCVAAAALVGLHKNFPRMAQDHALAQQFADGIAPLLARSNAGVVQKPETNMVMLRFNTATKKNAVLAAAKERGVLLSDWNETTIRVVTHCNLTPEMVSAACARMAEADGVW